MKTDAVKQALRRNPCAAGPPSTVRAVEHLHINPAAGRRLKLQRILVPLDFSKESVKALEFAVPLARLLGASIALVHVVEPAFCPPDFGYGPVMRQVPDRERVARAKTRLGILGRRILGPCRVVETVIRSGLAFFEITEAAKALGADLIIIGTHGYTGLARAVMGSTAEKVVRHAPCPVLVVRGKPEFVT